MANICPDALSKLRCSVCSRYLSYFPVYSDLNGSPRCGRCDNSGENISRNPIFELLAENMRFPCIYDTEGCKMFLIPSTMKDHEKYCPFRQITCFKSECNYSGCSNTLQNHLIEKHKLQILQSNEFEIISLSPQEKNLAVQYSSNLDSKLSQNFYLSIQIETNQINVKFVSSKMDVFESKLKFLLTFIYADTDIETLECTLDHVYNINILDQKWKNKYFIQAVVKFKEEEVPPPEIELRADVNYGILDQVKCSKCNNHILPKIYQCISGHNICSNCKKSTKVCPLQNCRRSINITRNYSLEKILKGCDFPCPSRKHGCMFVDKTDETKKHLKKCLYLPRVCPAYKCEWKNSKLKLFSHMYEKHLVLHNSAAVKFNVFGTKDAIYGEKFIIPKCNNLFKLVYSIKKCIHHWSVQYTGEQKNCKNYTFMLDFVDQSKVDNAKLLWTFKKRTK